MEDMRDIMKVLESQGNTHNMVEVQANSESRSLTLSPTRSPGPPQLQIDVQDAYEIGLGCSTYEPIEDKMNLPMTQVPGPT